jgi:hypothetical protein
MITKQNTLKDCLTLIESRLGWGDAAKWTNYDFEKLSEEIDQNTGIRLSVTTLKRIWGRLKYDSAPTLTTLNTLAQFAGYADWRAFEHSGSNDSNINVQGLSDQKSPETTQIIETAKPKSTFQYYWFLLFIPVSILVYALIPTKGKTRPANPEARLFSFKANKMKTEGVPNSVVFDYNAKAAKTDSVFIAQTWDVSRRTLVPKDKQHHSAIYYYPGYFNAKLIADGEIVKTHDLWITSDGWLALAEDEPVPIYFKKGEVEQNGLVQVTGQVLKNYHLSLLPKAPRVRIFNQRDMGNLMSDNFTFETYVKNDFSQGANACQPVQILIQCKNDIIIIPLAAKTCIGDIALAFCGKYVTSKESDLSKFGADLSQWTKVRVHVASKKANIFVNDVRAYTLDFDRDATGIVGVQYRFNGTGAVKGAWFQGGGEKINL